MRLRNMLAAMTTLVFALVVSPVLSPPPCYAAAGWTVNGVGVRALKSTAGNAMTPQIAPDGAGGAVVAWLDMRSVKWDIYAQRVDVTGKAMWKADGVGIRAQPGTPNNAWNHFVVPDGTGGAIVTWQDTRAGGLKCDIYAQRVGANGSRLWATDGVGLRSLPTTPGYAQYPRIVPDGSGGAVVTWQDKRSGSKYDIYAQRVDAGGHVLWATDGVAVRSLPSSGNDALYPQVIAGGSGGSILTWQDYRSGGKWDIYAQRLDASGHALWAVDGVPVRAGAALQRNAIAPKLAPAGSGGAIITWQDFRSGTRYDIYAQKLDSAGRPGWVAGGVSIGSNPGTTSYSLYPEIAVDGSGGAVITWQDYRSDKKWDIYAQRVDEAGISMWAPNGVEVSRHEGEAGDSQYPQVAPDGSGGAIVTWQEDRSGANYNVYAQGVDPSGKRLWTINGISIRSAVNNEEEASNAHIAPDGRGGAIVAWQDYRSGTKWDIYAQKTGPAASTFYFAEGYTGDNFDEYLCIGNPGGEDAAVDVTYLFTDGTTHLARYGIAKESRFTVRVNDEVGPGREVSIVVRSATAGLVVERPMYFNYDGRWTGGSDALGAPFPAKQWYFAEGTTIAGFDQYVTVLNPNSSIADLSFHYMVEGEGRREFQGRVGANSRATFKTRDQVGNGKNVSLLLESDQSIVAERPIYFDYQGLGGNHWTGGHDVVGTNYPSRTWYFAEGTTRAGFEEWLCLQNPNPADITVKAVFQLGAGQGGPVEKTYTVPANQRLTRSVNAEIGTDKDCSVFLSSTSEFIAERPMYFRYRDRWDGGHNVLGAMSPATRWFFAEGFTGEGFDEWLCLQNPSPVSVDATITYYPATGKPIVKHVTLAPDSRSTVDVNLEAGSGLEISAEVTSDRPVIVERPMYFDYKGWTGGHDVTGY